MNHHTPDCIFCKIVAGEIPSYKIYEDDHFLAFLDITQIVDGHALLIPKDHYRWVWDMPMIGQFYEVAAKLAKQMQKVSGEELVMSVTMGDMVPHAHLHLLPPTQGNRELILEGWGKAMSARKLPSEKMAEIQEKFDIR